MDLSGTISVKSTLVSRWVVLTVVSLCAVAGLAKPAASPQVVQPPAYGIGVSAGVAGHTGFAFRYYLAKGYLQASGIALMLNEGNFVATSAGLDYGRYLAISSRGGQANPAAGFHSGLFAGSRAALRGVIGVSGLSYRGKLPSDDSDAGDEAADASNSASTNSAAWSRLLSVSAGFGVDLGKVRGPGMAFALDARMSLLYDQEGFFALIFLPYGAVIYNW